MGWGLPAVSVCRVEWPHLVAVEIPVAIGDFPLPMKSSSLCRRRALAVAAALAVALPACAASKHPKPDAEPEAVHTSEGLTEVGTIAAVPYRIDVPTNWNHGLVVYFHGYSEGPYVYRATERLNEQTEPILRRGYAVIQSGYSAPGWALAEAYPESEQLRLYFLKHYGQPATGKAAKNMETLVAGTSMGGALVVAALELNPKLYAGGLNLCGSVGPTDLAFQRRFAWRAAFDFYFPGLMPPLVPTPADFQESKGLRTRVAEALQGNAPAAAALRGLTGLHSDREVAEAMVYFTFVIADMQHRAGGNPFDNRNFLYTGTSATGTTSDNALNDGVRRYAGDRQAREYLLRHYTPSGRLSHPMVSLHTTYDPKIPGATLALYGEQVALAGFSENLVQQYVHRDGHCTFTGDEVGRTFDELLLWIHGGRRPTPGLLPLPAQVAGR